MTHGTPVGSWEAARTHPATYPGRVPAGDYLILDDRVLPIAFSDPASVASAAYPDGDAWTPVDTALARRGLPALAGRTPVIAYGGNRNPATLALKLGHYGYRPGPGGVAVPVLSGRLRHAEAVAGGVSGQGYLYADLVLGCSDVCAEELQVWVVLADDELLAVLHESEGVDQRWYHVALVDELRLTHLHGRFAGLAYVTDLPCPVVPSNGHPFAFSSITASGRRIGAATPIAMIDRFLAEYGLQRDVAALTGLNPSASMAADLVKYLNGQWWYRQHTGERAIPGYHATVELLTTALERTTRHFHVVDRLREEGRILEGRRRFSPGLALRPTG